MTKVAILASKLRGHGRTKALLSIADELSQFGQVTIFAAAGSWPKQRLKGWHGFWPKATLRCVNWADGHTTQDLAPRASLCVAWSKPLTDRLVGRDQLNVAWVENGHATGVDGIWCPSQTVARQCRAALQGRHGAPDVETLYPTTYIDDLPTPTDRQRDIDVLIHGRKQRDALDRLPDRLTVETTGDLTFSELVERFERSKTFLHPHADRFEALGLMPLEAAHFGCDIFVPENSGAAELYPESAYDDPTAAVVRRFAPPSERPIANT